VTSEREISTASLRLRRSAAKDAGRNIARRDELARQLRLWTLVLASVGPSGSPSYVGAAMGFKSGGRTGQSTRPKLAR
jgi:hypothetical protein